MVLSWWGKGLLQICMHHWTVYAKVEFSRFPPDVRTGSSIAQFLTLNSEINFKILPILRRVHSKTFDLEFRNKVWHWYLLWGFLQYWVHYRHFKSAFSIQKNSKLTFSNGSQLMGKSLWQICMHHWTVYAKVEFPRFPPDVRTGRSIPQLLILNSEMDLKIFLILGRVHSPQLLNLNSEMKVWHWYLLWGFLQSWGSPFHTFQICILNYRK